jgi:hypothetical protein
MNKTLKEIFERVQHWPEDAQEKLARATHDIEEWLDDDHHSPSEDLSS